MFHVKQKNNDFIIIAIDGPAGVGKSTIASLLGEKLGILYVDTGAMFRCLAWCWEKQGCPEDEESLLKIGDQTRIVFEKNKVICDGTDVTDLIRSEIISSHASKISCFSSIREVMKKQQRGLIDEIRKTKVYKGAVIEGRDIGTVVFPNAEFKFYLDAPPEVRARRRMLQIYEKGNEENYEEILEKISERDNQDKNRKIAPLIPAKDAIIVNTGSMALPVVLEYLVSLVVSGNISDINF